MKHENIKHRIELLKENHKKQHKIVEALLAEKAPEAAVKQAKLNKLNTKDEIVKLEKELQL